MDLDEGCPTCDGPLEFLGQLGQREHYRCRDCGAECSRLRSELFEEEG